MKTEAQLDFADGEEFDIPPDQASTAAKPKAQPARQVRKNVLTMFAD